MGGASLHFLSHFFKRRSPMEDSISELQKSNLRLHKLLRDLSKLVIREIDAAGDNLTGGDEGLEQVWNNIASIREAVVMTELYRLKEKIYKIDEMKPIK
jgi:hypothetical protein